MFLPMFVALMLFLRSQRIWRIAAVVAVSIMAMAIMVTFSRQSYLIGILGLCVLLLRRNVVVAVLVAVVMFSRSEEHTSELQSLMRISYAVFCLKKKNNAKKKCKV